MEANSKKRAISRTGCFVLLIVLPCLAVLLLTAMGGLLVVADPLKRADAIVILSGGQVNRIQEAIQLYEEKYADTVILTETGAVIKSYNTQYSKEQRLILLDAGIPPTAILITPRKAASTLDEANDVKALIADKNIHDLIIVTDPYHTFRTRLIWKEVFSGSGINLIVRPARGSWYRSTTWFLSAKGWEYTLNEYAKLIGFIVLHKLD